MKFILKQKMMALTDTFDVLDEKGKKVYGSEQGIFLDSFTTKIVDASGKEVAQLEEKVHIIGSNDFRIIMDEKLMGTVSRSPKGIIDRYEIEELGWYTEGSLLSKKCEIFSPVGNIARINKKMMALTDTYEVNVEDPRDVLMVICMMIAIDGINRPRKE